MSRYVTPCKIHIHKYYPLEICFDFPEIVTEEEICIINLTTTPNVYLKRSVFWLLAFFPTLVIKIFRLLLSKYLRQKIIKTYDGWMGGYPTLGLLKYGLHHLSSQKFNQLDTMNIHIINRLSSNYPLILANFMLEHNAWISLVM